MILWLSDVLPFFCSSSCGGVLCTDEIEKSQSVADDENEGPNEERKEVNIHGFQEFSWGGFG